MADYICFAVTSMPCLDLNRTMIHQMQEVDSVRTDDLCLHQSLQSIPHARALRGFFFEIDVLKAERYVGVHVEGAALAGH